MTQLRRNKRNAYKLMGGVAKLDGTQNQTLYSIPPDLAGEEVVVTV